MAKYRWTITGMAMLAVVGCSSHTSTKVSTPSTAATTDPSAPGHSQTPPADFPPATKVPAGYTAESYEWSGAPGDTFRKLSATWVGSCGTTALFSTETALLLAAGWSVDGVLGAGHPVPMPTDGGGGVFRLAGFGWVGLGTTTKASPLDGRCRVSVALHQPGIDTPIT